MEKQNAWHHSWAQVDETSDPHFFIRFLDATREKTVRAAHINPAQFFSYLDPKPGLSILDAGCGTGDLLHSLSRLVGATGRVVGCDYSEAMIVEARKRAERSEAKVEFCVADAHQLPFPDSAFDRGMATSVLQHLENPAQALSELVRVLKPGGWVILTEPDWETQVVDAADRGVTRRILHFFSDSIRQGGIGHALPALFSEMGLKRIQVACLNTASDPASGAMASWAKESAVRAEEAGIITRQEAADWLTDQEARIRQGRFFSAFTSFRVSGEKA